MEKIAMQESAVTIAPEVIQRKLTESINFTVVSERKIEFTKAVAQRLIELPEFIGERPLRDSHVTFLINEAKRGTYLPEMTTLATCLCEWDGVERRLNGHHTSWLRQYTPDDWNPTLKLVKYSAPSEDDFRRLYSAMDRGAPRTRAHIMNCRLLGSEAFEGVGPDMLKYLGTGLRYYMSSDDVDIKQKTSVDEIADLLETKYLKTALGITKFWQAAPVQLFLRRGPVFGAMFATFVKAPEQSLEFWDSVRTGASLGLNDPRLRLRNLLMQTAVDHARGASFSKSLSPRNMMHVCLHCWNAWRKGEEMKLVKIPEKRPAVK